MPRANGHGGRDRRRRAATPRGLETRRFFQVAQRRFRARRPAGRPRRRGVPALDRGTAAMRLGSRAIASVELLDRLAAPAELTQGLCHAMRRRCSADSGERPPEIVAGVLPAFSSEPQHPAIHQQGVTEDPRPGQAPSAFRKSSSDSSNRVSASSRCSARWAGRRVEAPSEAVTPSSTIGRAEEQVEQGVGRLLEQASRSGPSFASAAHGGRAVELGDSHEPAARPRTSRTPVSRTASRLNFRALRQSCRSNCSRPSNR